MLYIYRGKYSCQDYFLFDKLVLLCLELLVQNTYGGINIINTCNNFLGKLLMNYVTLQKIFRVLPTMSGGIRRSAAPPGTDAKADSSAPQLVSNV